jgi:hypothetical protein
MNAIWNELLEYESKDLLERFFIKRFERKPSNTKIQQIASNFIQGREYFKSAQNSNITVKPLLQYYGVMALSKGIILSLSETSKEEHLKSSHGLEIINWKLILKTREFENLEIRVGNGTFSQLIESTENKNYLRSNSNVVNWSAHLKIPIKGSIVTLKQLIQYFPDLNKEYNSWIQENLNYAIIKSLTNISEDKKIHIKLAGEVRRELIEILFPTEFCGEKSIEFYNGETTVTYNDCNWYPNVTQRWGGGFGIGDACVIPTMKDDIGLNLLSGMYMMSYVFGMMARYYPTTWISIRRVEKGDKVYPFVHRILDFIDEKYPKQVLDFLRSPYKFD